MPLELEVTNIFDPSSNTKPPSATVVLRDYDSDGNGVPLVSNRCGTFTDFSREIDAAIKKLEQIRQTAKSKFGD